MSADLEQASLAVLTAAGDLVAAGGEDHESMPEIGGFDAGSPEVASWTVCSVPTRTDRSCAVVCH
jgi:hypothetical protein